MTGVTKRAVKSYFQEHLPCVTPGKKRGIFLSIRRGALLKIRADLS